MPLYDYECSKCRHIVEVRHGFDDTYAEPCSACGSALRRVINPAPIIFKGSGFYVTDSRKGGSSASSAAPAAAKEPAKESAPKEAPKESSKESAA